MNNPLTDIGADTTPIIGTLNNVSWSVPQYLTEGDKIKFEGQKRPFTVQATSKRYTVCSKPFNARKTTTYTIVDWLDRVRGPEDLIFGMGAETQEQCFQMLVRLLDGESKVSRRRRLPLDFEWAKSSGGELLDEAPTSEWMFEVDKNPDAKANLNKKED